MATTFREFITECELYEYSKEYYELMKECTEISLISKFVENHQFTSQYIPYMEATKLSVRDGFFAESIEDSGIQVLEEKASKGIKGFFSKIWDGITKLIDILIKFLKRAKKNISKAIRGSKWDRLKKKLFTKRQIVAMEDWWDEHGPKTLKYIILGAGGAGLATAGGIAAKKAIDKKIDSTEGDTIEEKTGNIVNELSSILQDKGAPIKQIVTSAGDMVVPLLPPAASKGFSVIKGFFGMITGMKDNENKMHYLEAINYITTATSGWKANKTFIDDLDSEQKDQIISELTTYRNHLQQIKTDLEVKANDVWSATNETDRKQLEAATQAIKIANQMIAALMGVMAEYDQAVEAAVAAVEEAQKAENEAIAAADEKGKAARDADKDLKKAENNLKSVKANPNAGSSAKKKAQKAVDDAQARKAGADMQKGVADSVKNKAKEATSAAQKAADKAKSDRAAAQAKIDAGENPDDIKRK